MSLRNQDKRRIYMQEKAFKVMGKAGATNLVIGITVLVGGIVSGILLIVHGGMLLSERKKLTF